jgi:hypothetical protein
MHLSESLDFKRSAPLPLYAFKGRGQGEGLKFTNEEAGRRSCQISLKTCLGVLKGKKEGVLLRHPSSQ